MEETINTKLLELYSSYWNDYALKLNEILKNDVYPDKPTNPLLLSHIDPKGYKNADIRLMIIGKQTNDWESIFNGDIKKTISVYRDFYKGFYFDAYRGYFKNHFNMFLQLIEHNFPNKTISCFWNNVIKTGMANEAGTPPSYILNLESEYFPVLEKEIDIIKPNLILFFTGSNYDQFIKSNLPKISMQEIQGFRHEDLQLLKIKNVDFAFRVSSPQQLHFSGRSNYISIYSKIISVFSTYFERKNDNSII